MTIKAPEAITQPMPSPTEAHLRTAVQALAYLIAFNAVTKQPTVFDDEREAALACIRDNYKLLASAPTLQSSLERTERELREAREALKNVQAAADMVYAMGNAEARRSLVECFDIARAALSNPSNPEKGEL
jgi:hypothetical protein